MRQFLSGKWHLGMHGSNTQDFSKSPKNQGFDYFYGLPVTNLKDFGSTGESVICCWYQNFFITLMRTNLNFCRFCLCTTLTGR